MWPARAAFKSIETRYRYFLSAWILGITYIMRSVPLKVSSSVPKPSHTPLFWYLSFPVHFESLPAEARVAPLKVYSGVYCNRVTLRLVLWEWTATQRWHSIVILCSLKSQHPRGVQKACLERVDLFSYKDSGAYLLSLRFEWLKSTIKDNVSSTLVFAFSFFFFKGNIQRT